jgi:hypothetical protein
MSDRVVQGQSTSADICLRYPVSEYVVLVKLEIW